jgi:hypothetical protein
VVRKNKMIFKTSGQQHYFNAPFQVGVVPPNLLQESLLNSAKDSEIFEVTLLIRSFSCYFVKIVITVDTTRERRFCYFGYRRNF